MGKLAGLYPDWLKNKKIKRATNDKFIVSYKELKIAYLYVENEEYVFEYTQEFKDQETVKPLGGFPDKNKTYHSKDFFPFFLSRIPDPNRPLIKESIEKKKIDPNNPMKILDEFGKYTLDNPFVVEKEKL